MDWFILFAIAFFAVLIFIYFETRKSKIIDYISVPHTENPIKLKKFKDPNKPKRPKSAFLLFCDQERKKLIDKEKKNLKKGDKFNLGVVQKKIGDMWNKQSSDKKKQFEEETEKNKELYYDKMTEYETSLETNA